jgi:hypothetical protein
MIHCGSGILGNTLCICIPPRNANTSPTAILMNIGRFFWNTPFKHTVRRIAQKIRASNFGKKEALITFDGDGDDGKLYMAARNACSNFAHANRAVIAHNVGETIQAVLGRDAELELLYDMPHILVSQEQHFDTDVWVHRNGTSRAYGPARMQGHPLFSQTGEPAFIPSSNEHRSLSLRPVPMTIPQAFTPAIMVPEKLPLQPKPLYRKARQNCTRKLASKGVHLYNGQSEKVIEQDSSHYKQIEDVIAGVRANHIVKPVPRCNPFRLSCTNYETYHAERRRRFGEIYPGKTPHRKIRARRPQGLLFSLRSNFHSPIALARYVKEKTSICGRI